MDSSAGYEEPERFLVSHEWICPDWIRTPEWVLDRCLPVWCPLLKVCDGNGGPGHVGNIGRIRRFGWHCRGLQVGFADDVRQSRVVRHPDLYARYVRSGRRLGSDRAL